MNVQLDRNKIFAFFNVTWEILSEFFIENRPFLTFTLPKSQNSKKFDQKIFFTKINNLTKTNLIDHFWEFGTKKCFSQF